MTQTRVGASRSKWLVFVKKVGVAWRQGKYALLIVLLQEILEDNSETEAHQTTINALRDLTTQQPLPKQQWSDTHLNGFTMITSSSS